MKLSDKPSPIILDGGLSNVLESYGCNLNNPLWTAGLLPSDQESIIRVHYDYIMAGAQIISTTSYQASIPGFMSLGYTKQHSESFIRKSVKLARQAIVRARENGYREDIWVAASMGPYGAFLADGSEYRGNYGIEENQLIDFHQQKIQILESEAIDLFAFETIPSYREAKVLSKLLKHMSIPSWVSFSCKDEKHVNDGTPIEDCIRLFSDHPSIFAVGVNCTHPKYISELIQRIRSCQIGKKLVVYPNSGEVYDASTKSWLGLSEPLHFGKMANEWVDLGVDLIGGCCRIGPDHIKELCQLKMDY